ncbi:replication initiator protein A [Oscillospiraceae bacterium 38-13]
MTDYMKITTELPPYFFFPWFLLDMDLTLTAKLTYALLLDRARLSQLNGWTDEAGRVYIVFPVEKIAAALNRSLSSAKNALAELSAAGLIERKRRGQFLPNLIYVKLPDGQRIVPPQTDNGLSFTGVENDLRNS